MRMEAKQTPIATLFLVVMHFMSFSAFADTGTSKKYFLSALVQYELLNYERAIRQLEKAEAKAQTPEDEQRIALLAGIVNAELGRTGIAREAFALGFGIDNTAQLPMEVSPKIVAIAEKVRQEVSQSLAPNVRAKYWPISPQVCYDADAAAAEIWSNSVRERLINQLSASKNAALTSSVLSRLNEWVELWADQQIATCLREKVRTDLSPTIVAKRKSCLREQGKAFSSVLNKLNAEIKLDTGLKILTGALPDPFDCGQEQRKNIATDEAAASARAELADANASLAVGNLRLAKESLAKVKALSASLYEPSLEAELLKLSAEIQFSEGDTRGAIASCQRAVARAIEVGNRRLAIRALSRLTYYHGDTRNDFATAQNAHAWAARLLKDEPNAELLKADLESVWASTLSRAGKNDQAQKVWEQLLQDLGRIESSEAIVRRQIATYSNLAMVADRKSEPQRSVDLIKKAIALTEKSFGPRDVNMVLNSSTLGIELAKLGRLDEAERALQSALLLAEELDLVNEKAEVSSEIGFVYLFTGKPQLAQTHLQAALDHDEKARGPDSPLLIPTLIGLGLAFRLNGQPEKAISFHRRAFELSEKLNVPTGKASAQVQLGVDLLEIEQWQELPAIIEGCNASTRKRLIDLDEVLWCEIISAELMWQTGRRSEAHKAMHRVFERRPSEKDLSAVMAKWVRNQVGNWFELHPL